MCDSLTKKEDDQLQDAYELINTCLSTISTLFDDKRINKLIKKAGTEKRTMMIQRLVHLLIKSGQMMLTVIHSDTDARKVAHNLEIFDRTLKSMSTDVNRELIKVVKEYGLQLKPENGTPTPPANKNIH